MAEVQSRKKKRWRALQHTEISCTPSEEFGSPKLKLWGGDNAVTGKNETAYGGKKDTSMKKKPTMGIDTNVSEPTLRNGIDVWKKRGRDLLEKIGTGEKGEENEEWGQ